MKYKLRPAVESDLSFIYKSWLLGAYHGNRPAKGKKLDHKAPVDYLGSIEQGSFMECYHNFIESQLKISNVVMACLDEDPDVVLGYAVTRGSDLVWVHVKPQWRGIGIARDLIPKNTQTCSSLTRIGDVIRRKRGWIFNPFTE